MAKFAILIHGGSGVETSYVKKNREYYEEGLREAVCAGQKVLSRGGSALNAVERSVICLEDNELFNAGRGSALNNKGEIEMDASIMDGSTLKAGAVSMVRNVKNPIGLARLVMSKTKHVLLSGYGAIELAKEREIILEPDAYFMTEHQYNIFLHTNKKTSRKEIIKKKLYETVGAVAIDKKGNIAAATSTGGTANKLPGRIGDSCIIGAGCYANNKTCAVSGTGSGEILIRGVIAHTISMFMELKGYSLQKACEHVIYERNKDNHIGIIAVNKSGKLVMAFNTEMMRCAWIREGEKNVSVKMYQTPFPRKLTSIR